MHQNSFALNIGESAIEKLLKTNPELEVWWDSSPLIYSAWAEKTTSNLQGDEKSRMNAYLHRLFDPLNPASTLFGGVTTNPPLTVRAFEFVPELRDLHMRPVVNALRSVADDGFIAWEVYKRVVKEGARQFMPLFTASNGKRGFVCGQVDPRYVDDTQVILRQALDLAGLAPNMMIKIPATRGGLPAFTALTALGVPTNATLCYTVPQIAAVAKAVLEGLEIGKRNGVDYGEWRSVITLMLRRFEEQEEFYEGARAAGVEPSERILRWAGIAVAKNALRLLEEMGYPGKLLLAAFGMGPEVGGKERMWHVEKLAGHPLVMTLNPSNIESVLRLYDGDEIYDASREEVPKEVLSDLMKIPYFVRGYEPDGIRVDEFATHPGTASTAVQFAQAMVTLEKDVARMR
ncbi:MAG: transaldolase family protein [Clostridia bacterium]